jgi:enoyl-CoA hydratase
MTADILFSVFAECIGVITLNRPAALNALNANMLQQAEAQMRAWELDPAIAAVVICGNGPRGFCAGGDLKALYYGVQQAGDELSQFFMQEYRFNYYVSIYRKPYISLIHGITMGGGVGASIHAQYRCASPDLVWAMPETGIGFFPDVGATFFLSRCPDNFGIYLALTGARIDINTAVRLDFVNFVIERAHLPAMLHALSQEQIDDYMHILRGQSLSIPERNDAWLAKCAVIKAIFGKPTMPEILQALVAAESRHPWVTEIITQLQQKSPLSLLVTLEAMQRGKDLSIDACINMEYQLGQGFLKRPDLLEGIRAHVLDKDRQPAWQHTFESIYSGELAAYVPTFFPKLENWLSLYHAY